MSDAPFKRWQREPLRFIEEVLVNPETGKPFELFPAQRTFFEHAFKTNEDGRFEYPEQVFGAPKKTGKTGTAMMHLLTTTILYGGRFAEAYACANDLEQAMGRVFQSCCRVVEASPLLKCEAEITQREIRFPQTGAVIRALGGGAADVAGAAPTISSFDELWGVHFRALASHV